MVTFTGIPEGVMVMVPAMVDLEMVPDTSAGMRLLDAMILDPAIDLMLREGTRRVGDSTRTPGWE